MVNVVHERSRAARDPGVVRICQGWSVVSVHLDIITIQPLSTVQISIFRMPVSAAESVTTLYTWYIGISNSEVVMTVVSGTPLPLLKSRPRRHRQIMT